MTFSELQERAARKQPGRMAVVGVSSRQASPFNEWKKRGWEVDFYEAEVSEAIGRALDAAAKGQADLVFCTGADNLKIIRLLDRHLEAAAPRDYSPLSVMQAFEIPTYPKLLWVGFTPLAQYDRLPQAIGGVETMVKVLAELGEVAARVALLSCVETISTQVSSTIWEATLAHMSQRGQFGRARVDGPLGFDLAIRPDAVTEKGVRTEVAGQADLLIPPDLNSFSSLVDAIHLTGEHKAAGIVVGGPCPVALPPHRSPRHVNLSLEVASLLA